jgi:hypothetical protein
MRLPLARSPRALNREVTPALASSRHAAAARDRPSAGPPGAAQRIDLARRTFLEMARRKARPAGVRAALPAAKVAERELALTVGATTVVLVLAASGDETPNAPALRRTSTVLPASERATRRLVGRSSGIVTLAELRPVAARLVVPWPTRERDA